MEKQIEEMAKYLKTVFPTKGMVSGLPIKINHDYKAYAELFFKAGYRKADEVRADTVREMQERLNEAFNSHSDNCRDCIKSKVDQIAKEMVGDKQ